MKILMALMGLEIGGAETHVVELSKELHKQGHTVIVASNGGVYEQTLEAEGIPHVKIPMHLRNAFTMGRSLRLLRALIQKEEPDLVHAHARIPAFLCGILQRQMGFPFITTAHWVFEVTPVLRFATNWGQQTVAVSEDIKDYLMQNYQVPADQIHVTINGIDTDQFAPGPKNAVLAREFGLGSGPVIGTVSRLDESRELAAKELIALMPTLLAEIPGVQLLIVGGGNYEEALRQQAEEVNRHAGRNAVVMTGPRTDIAELVGLCDVFVGVSRAALEAMSAEKPTILAGNEGYIGILGSHDLADAQDSNFCCRGFDPINPNVLLSDLLALMRMEPDQRQALGEFGRQLVLEQYSVARMTHDYLAAYARLLDPPPVTQAVISGYYGYGNLGDDAILLAISRQLSDAEHPVRLTVLSRRPEDTARQYGLKAVPRFSPWSVYRALKKSDILISGGGSLLQDKTSTRSLLYYLTVIKLAKHLHKPVFLYANGIGPLNREVNRKKVKQCLDRCDLITLRDEESLQVLRSLGILRDDIIITGDPVFTLTEAESRRKPLRELGVSRDAHVVGISVRRQPKTDHFVKEFAVLCDRLVREQGKTIVFLVMQESEDEPVSRQIQALMEEESFLAKTPGDPAAMLTMIRDMDALVSMRLHTIIFAANVNVPTVGCVYDPKVAALLNQLGMPSCGTPQDMEADQAFEITKRLLADLPQQKVRLAQAVSHLAPMAEETARLFNQMRKEN